MRKISHIVTRPGRKFGDNPVDIPVPQELATVPGIPQNSKDVSFYSREYPLQRQQVEHAADTAWATSVGTDEMQRYHHEHTAVMKPFYPLMNASGDLEPTGVPTGEDVTALIKNKARELGYLDVGITAHDRRYKRCRPVMIRYEGCAVCMKVCPINRYGAKAVMEHYLETGQILGKGTHNLEGYGLHPEQSGRYAVGYFGPGELPIFNAEFFDIPKGTRENAALDELVKAIKAEDHDANEGAEGDAALFKFRDRLRTIIHGEGVSDSTMF